MMQFVYNGWMSLFEENGLCIIGARLMRWSHDMGVPKERIRMVLFVHLPFVD